MAAFSQIPNESFENWTNGEPDNWWSSNGIAHVLPDSNSHSGFLALRLQITADSSGAQGTTLYTRVASSGSYYPLGNITPPTSIQFWAITNLLNGDVLSINTTLKNASNNIVALINGTCVSTNSSTYQLYNFPLTYTLPGSLPDSAATWFSFKNGSCVPNINPLHAGSFVIIDGISYDNPTGIKNEDGNEMIQSIYPNPASAFTSLNYQLKKSSDVKIQIFDAYGKIIEEYEESSLPAGNHSFPIDLNACSNGIYITSLTTNDGRDVSKMIVNRR